MLMRNQSFLVIFTVVAFAAVPLQAQALPAFAKAYGVQCSVCHTMPPQLNAYGRYIQRTGYSALNYGVLKSGTPVSVSEEVNYDSQDHQVVGGNLAVHAAGYLSPDITYHIHQWLVQDDQAGGIDVFQLAYNQLFKGNGHLFAGKISALAAPAPFSNQSDLAPYASAELQVGEHVYQTDATRWGAALSYVHANLYAEAGWFGSSGEWGDSTNFSSNTEKTFQWIAAYADPAKPLEVGAYGSVGSFPLSDGGVDHYNSTSLYVQRDPGPHFVPGIFAVYQWSHDANPGIDMDSGLNLPSANSTAETFEIYEPLFDRGIIGFRQETTSDGLGNVTRSGNVDLALQPFAHYDYLHLYLEGALMQNSGPAWRGSLWWIVPLKF